MAEEQLHLIKCRDQQNGIRCEYGMLKTHGQDRCVRCGRWKANRARDGYHYGCDKDFAEVSGR